MLKMLDCVMRVSTITDSAQSSNTAEEKVWRLLGSCSCIEILAGHVVGREGIWYSDRTKCQRRKAYGGAGTEKKEDLGKTENLLA